MPHHYNYTLHAARVRRRPRLLLHIRARRRPRLLKPLGTQVSRLRSVC